MSLQPFFGEDMAEFFFKLPSNPHAKLPVGSDALTGQFQKDRTEGLGHDDAPSIKENDLP